MGPQQDLARLEREPVVFVADLHLDAARPAMIDRFQEFCRGPARAAAAVFVLGDLFEVWIGDDDDDPALAPVLDTLAALTAAGVDVAFMAGNRDFLAGEAFARRTGVTLLEDPAVVELLGTPTLLCHGDTLCTGDVAYQRFRAQVRDPAWQRGFLEKPLAERRRLAAGLRGDSRDATAGKDDASMDVSAEAVVAAVRAHGVARVIHGHTHRPGRHAHTVDGRAVERWVLGDWYQRASMLVARRDGLEAVDLDDDARTRP